MKKFAKFLSIALAFAMVFTIGVAASSFYPRVAGVKVFSGHVEDVGGITVTTDHRLIVSAEGQSGTECDISSDVTFPVLADAYGDPDTHLWASADGKPAVSAPMFTLTATDSVEQVSGRIEVTGDLSTAQALRFGITVCQYFNDDHDGCDAIYTYVLALDEDGLSSEPIFIGDMLAGEKAEIYISAWVMADFLTEHTDGDINVEVAFTAQES